MAPSLDDVRRDRHASAFQKLKRAGAAALEAADSELSRGAARKAKPGQN